jgi:hypothetical protein
MCGCTNFRHPKHRKDLRRRYEKDLIVGFFSRNGCGHMEMYHMPVGREEK